jgi:serine/threonine protein kinase
LAPLRARQLDKTVPTREGLLFPRQGAADMGGPSDPYDENLSGKRIAENYEILDKIGEGGMSAVYRGRHLHLNREVAVKMLHPHLIANRVSRERFSQEARAVSQIEHPNVVHLIDFGITEENRPYIVMDFLRGQALSQVIKSNGPLDVQQALPIFLQICDALSYTHAKGIVHRDLKPSNVILLERRRTREEDNIDGDYVAKIVDFGIAKLSPLEDSGVAALTQTGDVFGSPLYMSPEQARGEKLDNRADIYSMGCLMYETLSGVPPINGANMLEILYRHMNEMPQPLNVVAKDKTIPRPLEAIVFKALAKDPKDRYQDMASLAADLQKFEESSAGLMGSLASLWTLYRSRRKRLNLREKIATIVTISAAVAILGVAVIFTVFYIKGTQNFSDQEIPWLKVTHKSTIETIYSNSSQFAIYSTRAADSRLKELRAQVEKGETIVPEAEDYDTVQALIRQTNELRQQDNLQKAARMAQTLVDMATIVHGNNSLITRQAMTVQLMTFYDSGKFKDALNLLEKMKRDIPEPTLYARPHFKAVLFSISGECKYSLKDYEGARADLLEALNNWEEADRDQNGYDPALSEISALSTSYFADTFAIDGMWEEANKYYERAAKLWKKAAPPRDDYNQALALFKESLDYCHMKDEKLSEERFNQAIEILRKHPKDFLFYQTEVQMEQILAKLDQQQGYWLGATQKYIQAGLAKNKSNSSDKGN